MPDSVCLVVEQSNELDKDLAAFETMRAELEAHSNLKWAVLHDAKLIGVFDSFDAAAAEAVSRFGRGPYLIRQVGAQEFTMPASVAYRIG